ncbi:diguanylate cyclase (GGDEF)-like protein [Nitrosospira sp. Nsp2]|uniref:GGDEF domain-containing protein n=1 Tax=Nitrosospira sp. Nsp2 TaxID=136548 RepID=UPI000D2F9C6E|nr:GGDEF domain-containing protein [Nitrosospira sp. Nsp2]PTR17182.1 diguanylate cyclase (GGDEF)-like protein [Nitrosospira sp. Nsp2]
MSEKSLAAREDAVYSREITADLREKSLLLREKAMEARERATTALHATDRVETESGDHLGLVKEANAQLVVAIIEAHKLAEGVEAANAQLDHLAHHDALTGLPNRLLLQDRLSQTIALAHRQGGQFALLFMDLDEFKKINDSVGHDNGDQLLQSVAQRLVGCMRNSDTVCRQGGDEFLVLLTGIKHRDDAAASAQKIVAALIAPHRINELQILVSISIGISIYPDDGQDAQALVKNADIAMYHAKENGRNNYHFFEKGMDIQHRGDR